jgi:hypothetical protein
MLSGASRHHSPSSFVAMKSLPRLQLSCAVRMREVLIRDPCVIRRAMALHDVPFGDCARSEEIRGKRGQQADICWVTWLGLADPRASGSPRVLIDARMLKTEVMRNMRNPLFEEMIDLRRKRYPAKRPAAQTKRMGRRCSLQPGMSGRCALF